ncbi:MAG: hypothetical protein JWM36_4849 [Hyphomicrobiales bacterium]|nr:hypothetical protein [Hyphomicrobiales bacterium]
MAPPFAGVRDGSYVCGSEERAAIGLERQQW